MGEGVWREGALPLWGLRPHSPRDILGKMKGFVGAKIQPHFARVLTQAS